MSGTWDAYDPEQGYAHPHQAEQLQTPYGGLADDTAVDDDHVQPLAHQPASRSNLAEMKNMAHHLQEPHESSAHSRGQESSQSSGTPRSPTNGLPPHAHMQGFAPNMNMHGLPPHVLQMMAHMPAGVMSGESVMSTTSSAWPMGHVAYDITTSQFDPDVFQQTTVAQLREQPQGTHGQSMTCDDRADARRREREARQGRRAGAAVPRVREPGLDRRAPRAAGVVARVRAAPPAPAAVPRRRARPERAPRAPGRAGARDAAGADAVLAAAARHAVPVHVRHDEQPRGPARVHARERPRPACVFSFFFFSVVDGKAASDSAFSPAATPFPGGAYYPFLPPHLRAQAASGNMTARSSPSHFPLEIAGPHVGRRLGGVLGKKAKGACSRSASYAR